MMKKIICYILIGAFVLTAISPLQVKAETLRDYKNKVAELEKQKAESDALTAKAKRNIESKSQAIINANNNIVINEGKVEASKIKVAESQEKIKIKTSEMKDSIKVLQYLGNNTDELYMDYVFDASSVSELMERQYVVEQIINNTKKELDDLSKLIDDNKILQEKLTTDNQNLENSIAKYEQQLEELQNYVNKQASVGLGFADQIKVQKNLIKMYEKAGCKDNDNIDDCYYSKMEGSGSFSRPLNKGRITQTWKKGSHYGIDIGGNKEGTPVYAPASGTVIYVAKKTSCGGNIVYMNSLVDGKKYTIEMAHLLSIKVKTGQKVQKGQIVGTIGGYSTSHAFSGSYDYCAFGAHLHYAISYGYFFSKSGRSQWSKFQSNTGATAVQSISGLKNQKNWRFTTRG